MTAAGGDEGEGVIFSFNPATPTPTPTATPYTDPGEFPNLTLFHVRIIRQGAAWAPDAGSQWDHLIWDDTQGWRAPLRCRV
jgi:hypothetical protein